MCYSCGKTQQAPNNLPAKGSYGKNLVGFIAELRASRVPLNMISRGTESLTGIKISTSTINGIIERVSDALAGESALIAQRISESPSAGFDETMHRDSGKHRWANVAQSGNDVSIQISSSRATLMLDTMDYSGIAVTDAVRVYDRFDKNDRHQLCWSHDLRKAEDMSERHDPSISNNVRKRRRQYLEDLRFVFREAKHIAKIGAHSTRQRHVMEMTLADILARYGDTDDVELSKHVKMMNRYLPHLFTFVEHAGVEPTNNASERALRYYVVFRKIIYHTKGGSKAMKRLGDFISCVLTWRNHCKSVAHEVARLI